MQGFLIFTIYILLSKSRRKYIKFVATEKFKKLKKSLYKTDATNKSQKSNKSQENFNSKSTETDVN